MDKKKRKRDKAQDLLARVDDFLDQLHREHPEIMSRVDDDAFLRADLDSAFGPDADDAFERWLVSYAMQIVTAELRGGEAPPDLEMSDITDDELWELYQRREKIDSPRVRRAIDVLDAVGFILPPELRDGDD